ncbi:S24/S26 family peptidase [Nocardioides speluncae]|uniref:S24/S26 family peptidase n=1 Tax=Nocardioides speluncae TaxID=2670337 RepID=UPI001F0BBE20|nr:S24/S26 family peptidase [Nocardioides speluncae]
MNALLPLGMAVVRGRSMEPALRAGDRLLVRYGARVRPGAVVLARFADGTLAVKRAAERRTDRAGEPAWWLLSDNADDGVDSRHRGPVSDRDVLAVVQLRLWPRPARTGVTRWGPRATP